ncbi:hypothetical protein [Streptomyces sp. NPDC093795]|uniref:hypothetical protein n=1 Tax=Streptomyces sp. NPDC093795 TaxID=3366051 RepID=UPI0037F1A447
MCRAAPVPASSGRTNQHRINRGGDRGTTNGPGLRRQTHHRGISANDIVRCLKRFVAREVYRHLRSTGILNTAGSANARS